MTDRPELGAQRHNVPPKKRPPAKGVSGDMQIHANIMSCAEGMHTVQEAEEFLVNSGVVTKTRIALISLENLLLDIASSENVTAGVHYHICLSDGISSKVARYFEAGCLQGMINQEITRDFIPYKIFSVADIVQRNIQLKERFSRSHQKRTAGRENVKPPRWRPARCYDNLLKQIKRKWEDLMAIIKTCNVVFHSAVLSVMKKNPKGNSPDDHYLQVIGHETEAVNILVVEHRVTGDQRHDEVDVLCGEFTPQCLQDQIRYLSSLPNLHSDGSSTHSSLQRNFSVAIERSRVPVSVRNKIIYYSLASDINNVLKEIAFLKGESSERPVKKKPKVYRRNFHGRVSQETASDLRSESPTMPTISMAWSEEDNLFDLFVHQLINNGKVSWREHAQGRDSFLLTSYNAQTGHILPDTFEHLVLTTNNQISCSCETFVFLQNRHSDSISDGLTCMHERLIATYLLPFYDDIVKNSCPSKKACQTFQEAYMKCKSPIELITPASNPVPGTVKFSVLGLDGTLRFVHLSFNGTYIACQSGQCALNMGMSGRVKSRQIRSLAAAKLCAHLQVMLDHFEEWSNLISEDDEAVGSDVDDPETEVAEIDQPGTVLENGM